MQHIHIIYSQDNKVVKKMGQYAGCGYPQGGGYAGGFALIVVLFILLIIVGASFY